MNEKWFIKTFGTTWYEALKPILNSQYFKNLGYGIAKLRENTTVHPSSEDMFKAFKLTPLNKVKVVFCGQDPYFSKNYADGLLFSNSYVLDENSIAPSLNFILKEVDNNYPEWKASVEYGRIDRIDLTRWAKQGVLLINKAFSTPQGLPGAHLNQWELFIKQVFYVLNQQRDLVVVLFGKEAQKCLSFQTNTTHSVLNIIHPAAESYREGAGFLGSKVFKRVNEELELRNKSIIHW